jgi:hypothetical protein
MRSDLLKKLFLKGLTCSSNLEAACPGIIEETNGLQFIAVVTEPAACSIVRDKMVAVFKLRMGVVSGMLMQSMLSPVTNLLAPGLSNLRIPM